MAYTRLSRREAGGEASSSPPPSGGQQASSSGDGAVPVPVPVPAPSTPAPAKYYDVDPNDLFNDLFKSSSPSQIGKYKHCLLYTSPSPRDQRGSRMPSSA